MFSFSLPLYRPIIHIMIVSETCCFRPVYPSYLISSSLIAPCISWKSVCSVLLLVIWALLVILVCVFFYYLFGFYFSYSCTVPLLHLPIMEMCAISILSNSKCSAWKVNIRREWISLQCIPHFGVPQKNRLTWLEDKDYWKLDVHHRSVSKGS